MAYDTPFVLLGGARPTNAASFADPFGAYDIAGMVARGLQYLSAGNRMVAAVGGHAQEYANIATGRTAIEYQALGQTGTLTKKFDAYLAGSASRPSIEWSDHTDLYTRLSENVLPGTNEFWIFGSHVPLRGTCQIFGQSDATHMQMTAVNTELRFSLLTSGAGGRSLSHVPDGGNLINRTVGYFAGRRQSTNVIEVEAKLAGGAWLTTPASQPATSGAGGTGSSLTVDADLRFGASNVVGGYSPYKREGIKGVWTGNGMTAQDRLDLKELISMYSGL